MIGTDKIFTARCYAQRGLCCRKMSVCLFVCPSVCPSVTRRYSIETAKHIMERFAPSGSYTYHSSFFFRTKRYGNMPTGTLTRQGRRISTNALCPKLNKIELYLRWPTNRKSYMQAYDRTAPFSMIFNNSNPVFKVKPFLTLKSPKRLTTQPQLLQNANRKPYQTFEWCHFQ